jgi:hypothetical protein
MEEKGKKIRAFHDNIVKSSQFEYSRLHYYCS